MFEKIINEIQSVSAISEKIVFRLVNTKMNESVLKERPHRKFWIYQVYIFCRSRMEETILKVWL